MARSRNGQAISPSRRTPQACRRLASFVSKAKKRGDLRAWRRAKAVLGYIQGKKVIAMAAELDVTRGSINRWLQWYEADGMAGLVPKKPPGGPSRMSKEDLCTLEELLLQGAKAHGWNNELWTANRVREVIQRELGISYSKGHTWRILRNHLNWTPKKPIVRYGGRDEDKIRKWPRTTFRRIVAEARRSEWYIAFADEAGFLLSPTTRRTFSPRGTPTIINTADPHGRISTNCAITLSPRTRRANLHVQMLPPNENYTGNKIADFLSRLAERLNHPFVLIWDCYKIHHGRPVKELLRRDKRIHLRFFPPYASELNPVDKVWAYLKYSRLANYAPKDLVQLRRTLTSEVLRLKKNTQLIHSFVKATGLDPYT